MGDFHYQWLCDVIMENASLLNLQHQELKQLWKKRINCRMTKELSNVAFIMRMQRAENCNADESQSSVQTDSDRSKYVCNYRQTCASLSVSRDRFLPASQPVLSPCNRKWAPRSSTPGIGRQCMAVLTERNNHLCLHNIYSQFRISKYSESMSNYQHLFL